MSREIILDTETTGLDPKRGDRLIEIGCVELFDRVPTGKEYHCFIQPDRVVPPDAVAIHGITDAMLVGKPRFSEVADAFVAFIADTPLVIHNASFDVGFLNAELERAGKPVILMSRVVDTLQLARRKHPAGPNSLDALCRRYGIDNSKRDKHGAIVDSLLLAQVYIEMLGERQASLLLASKGQAAARAKVGGRKIAAKVRPEPLPTRLSEADVARHGKFVETLGEKAAWKKFSGS